MRFRRAMTCVTSALLLALLAGPAVLAAPGAASSVEDAPAPSTTWTIGPAGEDGADSRISIRQSLDAGEAVEDHVVVTNFGPDEATFRVYASDGVVSEDGTFDLLPPETDPTDGGSWVTLGEDNATSLELTLDAEESAVIDVAVSAPENATPGDHPVGVVAELVSGDSDGSLTSRVGVRLHLRVAGDALAQVQAEATNVSWSPSWNPFSPGSLSVDMTLENTGNVRVGPEIEVGAAGPFGLAGTSTELSRRELLPGQELTDRVELGLWGLIRTSGEIVVTPTVVGEDDPPDAVETTQTPISALTVPWIQVILLALLVLLPVWLRRRRRRAESKVQDRIDAAVAAAAEGRPENDSTSD